MPPISQDFIKNENKKCWRLFSYPILFPSLSLGLKKSECEKSTTQRSQKIFAACFIFFLVLCLDPLENRDAMITASLNQCQLIFGELSQ